MIIAAACMFAAQLVIIVFIYRAAMTERERRRLQREVESNLKMARAFESKMMLAEAELENSKAAYTWMTEYSNDQFARAELVEDELAESRELLATMSRDLEDERRSGELNASRAETAEAAVATLRSEVSKLESALASAQLKNPAVCPPNVYPSQWYGANWVANATYTAPQGNWPINLSNLGGSGPGVIGTF